MKSLSVLLALVVGTVLVAEPASRSANAATPAPVPLDGAALYREKCAMCHNKTGMGTGLLARRVKNAELLARTDLNADFVFQAARAGIGNMPAIPRGEASDAQLRAIAAYLAGPREGGK